ncbi:MAG TPA: TonB-dependent receptor [Pyrinomonadaceae bacterium]|jgi:hypothetical protein
MKNLLKKTMSVTGTALMLVFVLCSATLAQETTAGIVGIIKDVNGAAVSGATVTITDPTKDNAVVRTMTTGEDGSFSVPNLQVSVYNITVEAANFKKYIQTAVELDVNQRRNVDIVLEAGNVAEVVTVEAGAVAVELNTPTAGTTINGDQVRELSINNRNFVQLVTLAPGVSHDLSDQVYVGSVNPDGQANTINISVNGARSAQNTYRVDGADITDRGSNITIQGYPSVDSIREFKVDRSLFPAESGSSGGGQVNVVTRAGTDDFHGNAFEFVRNEVFNANDFITNSSPGLATTLGRDDNGKIKRRPFRYNNYGFTIGGPIYFLGFGEGGPAFKKYKRTYFFFSEERRKDVRFPTLNSTVPSAGLRQGVFPVDVCLSANAPTAATATCTNILPAGTPISSRATVNPVSQQYVNFVFNNIPLPTNPATLALNYPTFYQAKFDQQIFKFDTNFTDDLSAYYRYQRDEIPTIDPNALFSQGTSIPGVSTTESNSPGRTHTLSSTYVINPNMILEGRYAYGYGAILSKNIGLLAKDRSPISIPLPYENSRDRVSTVGIAGFNTLGGYGPYDNFSWKQNLGGTFTWITGRHTMKYGGVYSWYRKNENNLVGFNEGSFTNFLNTVPTSPVHLSLLAPGVAANTLNASYQSFANFLLGTNASFTQSRFDYTADLRQKTIEAFAQDEFRFRQNITLYYGVRYSFFGSPYDKNGLLSNFDPSLFNPGAAPQVTGAGNRVVGTGNYCNGIIVNSQNYQTGPPGFNCTPAVSPYGKFVVDAPKKDFAPRIGIAWDPFKKGTTSIRTGYGIYYDQILNGVFLNNIIVNAPFQQTISINNTRIDQPVPTGTNPTAAAAATASNLRAVQPDWKTPYMQHWSLDLQQQLGKNTIFSIGYYGSKGTHLIGAFELNEVPPGFARASSCATGANTLQTPNVTTVPCQVPGTAIVAGTSTNQLDQIRPYRGYRSITMIKPQFNSNYNSLQVSAQRRFSGASQVNVAYTWSKNLTDNQTDRSTAPQNSYDISLDKGRATLDRRHVFSLNYVYELPFFSKQEGFVGKVFGGWQASGIVSLMTGLPFTPVTSSYDPAGLGFISAAIAGGRPNVLCNPNENAPRTQQQYFNTACFEQNPATNATGLSNTVGSGSRGMIHGPGTKRVDFTMTKNIRFTESIRLQLRGEAFNVFNTTNFRTFSSLNVTSAAFGQIGTVRDPRTLQFGIKFYF